MINVQAIFAELLTHSVNVVLNQPLILVQTKPASRAGFVLIQS
jgi:hypothetical protein